MRLALRLGHVNVDRMLDQISWEQFNEWAIYAELEPWDEERADLRSAQIVTMLANVNRDTKKRRKPFSIQDFLLPFGDLEMKPQKQTWQEQKQIGKMLAQMFNQQEEALQSPKRRRG